MIDENKIKQGVILLLEGIGEDLSRPGLLDTPERIAKMYREIVGGMDENPAIHLEKTFPLETQSLVIEKDITFYSVCEHHMLPFFGKVHIAYLPDKKVVGLSKLARTVDIFSKRLQIQEQMVEQIAQAIMDYLQPQGVMVIAEAEHLCMTMRGVKKPGSKTMSMVTKGVFTSNTLLQSHFFKAVGM